MKERPILFSGPMVKAILDGRKTQTRRAASHPLAKSARVILGPNREGYFDCIQHDETGGGILCPYGAPGDRLWVRETFCHNPNGDPSYWYAADGIEPEACDMDGFARYRNDGRPASPWAPSIHMPRIASRITLEIEAVRVERLQDISEEDAKAEGMTPHPNSCDIPPQLCSVHAGPVTQFLHTWESINGPGSWDANPWVWVIQFRRVQ